MARSSVYFPNLNGLRFVAALLVIIHHVEQYRGIYGEPNAFHSPFFSVIGKLGVMLFFVLSGFLITYLLLAERQEAGRIAVGRFYLRRILRIWPLYYAVVVTGLFVLPHIHALAMPGWSEALPEHFAPKSALYLAFLPNLANALYTTVPYVSQTWSIGVEEQFYLLWPPLLRVLRSPYAAGCVVIGGYFAVSTAALAAARAHPVSPGWTALGNVLLTLNIDCMAIGGLAGALLFGGPSKLLKGLFSVPSQVVLFVGTPALLGFGVSFPVLHYEIYSVLFSGIILNLAGNPRCLLSLEAAPLRYLGRISYGLYMYHFVCVVIAIRTLQAVGVTGSLATHTTALGLTVALASASYAFLEQPFLRLKVKYSKVVSGDNAAAAA